MGSFRAPEVWGRRALLVALVALVVLVQPVLAAPTTTAELINELRYKLLIIAIPVTLVTEAALYYAVSRFKDNDEPKPTQENRRLEVTWTLATAVILLFVGAASYGVLAQPALTAPAAVGNDAAQQPDVVVQAEGYQWGWEFTYTQHQNVSTDTKLVLPTNARIRFDVTSRDVVHSFAVPEMGLKQDAFPGQTNTIVTETLETGTYQGYCMEFCGVSHSKMTFSVEVVSQQEYEDWLADQERKPADDES